MANTKILNEEEVEIINKGKKYLNKLGPGLITGASDDDPSGIATYSQTGAQFGVGLLWLSLWTFPLLATIQEICARIGLVTGKGLGKNIAENFPKKILYLCAILLLINNTFNIGVDLGVMSKSVQLIFPSLPFIPLVFIIGVGTILLEIFIPYKKYTKYLKWLVISLFSYIITLFVIKVDWSSTISHLIIPNIDFSREQILIITAFLGTTITPYMFFWQTSQEIEEKINDHKDLEKTNNKEIGVMRKDVWFGMFFSNIVAAAIIIVCANTLYANGIFNIDSAEDAARVLIPIAGQFAGTLFAIGIIGTGLLAIPILAGSASYLVSESFGWKEGLYRRFSQAKAFYIVIVLSIFAGILCNIFGINVIKGLIYSAILNGIITPIILILIMLISSNERIMGRYKNSVVSNLFGWITTIITAVVAVVTLYIIFS